MWKSTFYSLFICVLECLVWAPGSSQGECLTVRDVCYQLFKSARPKHHSEAFCGFSGGRMGGAKYDIVEIMNTDPAMKDFLPKTDCYWVARDDSMTAYVENLQTLLPTQVIPVMPAMKTRTTRKVKDSATILDGPLFDRKASSQTLCSRMCLEFTGCSLFNYNTVTKECRGFQHLGRICARHHPDWEVWAVE